jgi:hypothetical protein
MLKHLMVIAVLLAGCGPQDPCTGTGSNCGELHSSSMSPPGTGTHLFQCVDGHTQLTYCAKGCVIGGSGADVCNP